MRLGSHLPCSRTILSSSDLLSPTFFKFKPSKTHPLLNSDFRRTNGFHSTASSVCGILSIPQRKGLHHIMSKFIQKTFGNMATDGADKFFHDSFTSVPLFSNWPDLKDRSLITERREQNSRGSK